MMYSVCSAVGWRSLLAPAWVSHSSAARRSTPRRTKLSFLPFASHSMARVSRRVCARFGRRVEGFRIAAEDPVQLRERLGHSTGVHVARYERDHALVLRDGVRDLFSAHH
jgi:hypothetical protein